MDSDAVINATPPRSRRRAVGERDSRTVRLAASRAITPIGRLIRKMGRQPNPKTLALTSKPPSTFPEKDAVPTTMPKKPNALARSFTGKVTWINESTCGNNIAAMLP